MKCVVNLYGKNNEKEIVTDVEDDYIERINEYLLKENIGTDELVVKLIENFIESRRL